MPATLLLRFELALFGRSFADAFARKRDRLLLAIVAALGLLWLRHALSHPGALDLPPGWEWAALVAAPVAFQWNRMVSRRLDWLAEESPLAPCAADRAIRRRYRLAAQLPILVPLLGEMALLGAAGGRAAMALGLAVAAYGLGTLAAPVRIGRSGAGAFESSRRARPPLGGPRTARLALLRVQTPGASRPMRAAALLVAADACLTFAGARLTLGAEPGAHFAASLLPSLLLLAATFRNDARLVGFLAFAGYGPGFVASAVCALPALSFAVASAAVLASGTGEAFPVIGILALLHLAAALLAILRAWLSPGKDPRKVDLQVTAEAAGLVVIGSIQPLLGLAALAFRLWKLCGLYRDSIRLHP